MSRALAPLTTSSLPNSGGLSSTLTPGTATTLQPLSPLDQLARQSRKASTKHKKSFKYSKDGDVPLPDLGTFHFHSLDQLGRERESEALRNDVGRESKEDEDDGDRDTRRETLGMGDAFRRMSYDTIRTEATERERDDVRSSYAYSVADSAVDEEVIRTNVGVGLGLGSFSNASYDEERTPVMQTFPSHSIPPNVQSSSPRGNPSRLSNLSTNSNATFTPPRRYSSQQHANQHISQYPPQFYSPQPSEPQRSSSHPEVPLSNPNPRISSASTLSLQFAGSSYDPVFPSEPLYIPPAPPSEADSLMLRNMERDSIIVEKGKHEKPPRPPRSGLQFEGMGNLATTASPPLNSRASVGNLSSPMSRQSSSNSYSSDTSANSRGRQRSSTVTSQNFSRPFSHASPPVPSSSRGMHPDATQVERSPSPEGSDGRSRKSSTGSNRLRKNRKRSDSAASDGRWKLGRKASFSGPLEDGEGQSRIPDLPPDLKQVVIDTDGRGELGLDRKGGEILDRERQEERRRAEDERRRTDGYSQARDSNGRFEMGAVGSPATSPGRLSQQMPGRDSVYSDYSYYDMPPQTPVNPGGANNRLSSNPQQMLQVPGTSGGGGNGGQNNVSFTKLKSAHMHNKRRSVNKVNPSTPDDFLQVGIDYHESGELSRAAWCFERSAKVQGGCGAGMMMWGLSLRHGWGVQIDEERGFKWIQKAAESSTEDLDALMKGYTGMSDVEKEAKAAKSELVLSLHEMGNSFLYGWGVPKDKKMALSYYELAANMGDPDAQQQTGYCYANGKGCKVDKKKAAKFYRMAVAQGAQTFGLSWIHKEKYDD